MSDSLAIRLNKILPHITSNKFLSSAGIGNEIPCHIFDYLAEDELQVRNHIESMLDRLRHHHRDVRVLHLNLFDIVLSYLDSRGMREKALEMSATKTSADVLRALRGPLAAEKICDFIGSKDTPAEYDLMLLTGVGSVWPMLRAHSLLNSLHKVIENTPLVMFYPGNFDGTTLRLFGTIPATKSRPGGKSYYRAFTLIPE